jgi:hypothetical protein
MQIDAGQPIVDAAIQLLMQTPETPALAILDRTMQSYLGTSPRFSSRESQDKTLPHPCYADELNPPSPFAELVRRAFAPYLDPRELMLLALPNGLDPKLNTRVTQIREQWQEAVEDFATRYRLWS